MKLRPPVKFHWKGNHHLYYGIFFVAFGIFNWYMGIGNGELDSILSLWYSCIGIGLYMIIDDIVEHTVTADTPLRLLYEKIRPYLRK